jgi:hypothetical protein
MKKDGEIKLLLEERGKGVKQELAAARTGMMRARRASTSGPASCRVS